MTRPLAIASRGADREQQRNGGRERQQGESCREEEQAGAGERGFAKHFHEPADQAALQDDADDPDETKQVAGLARVKAELLFGKEREERRHDGEAR